MRPLLRAQSLEFTSDPDKKYCLVTDATTTNKDKSTLMGIGLLDQVGFQNLITVKSYLYLFIDHEISLA